jgi:hypothetical protein
LIILDEQETEVLHLRELGQIARVALPCTPVQFVHNNLLLDEQDPEVLHLQAVFLEVLLSYSRKQV